MLIPNAEVEDNQIHSRRGRQRKLGEWVGFGKEGVGVWEGNRTEAWECNKLM
jgi:hypothetical protein